MNAYEELGASCVVRACILCRSPALPWRRGRLQPSKIMAGLLLPWLPVILLLAPAAPLLLAAAALLPQMRCRAWANSADNSSRLNVPVLTNDCVGLTAAMMIDLMALQRYGTL